MSGSRTSSELAPVLALVLITLVWGSTFVIIKDAVATMPISSFLAVRFGIATIVLLALRPRSLARLDRRSWLLGTMLGVLYGIGQLLQTWGLSLTSPSVSGFVTALYVVFTPLIVALVLRRRVEPIAWLSMLIALAGVAVLSLNGLAIGDGELLTAVAAFVYAAHIVALSDWSRGRDPVALSIVQLGACAIVCAAFVPIEGGARLPATEAEWFAVLYTAIAAGILVLLLQTWAQARITPTKAAIVMMLEPVFAAGFAVALGVDDLTIRMVVGGSMILAATLIVELGPRRGADAVVPHPGPP
jgi:drug/metabolite transporter (DMT)-like permease